MAEQTGESRSNTAFEAWLVDRLQAIYRGRRWIVATEIDQGAARMAAALRDRYGAETLAVGARLGTGAIDPDVPLVSLGLAEAPTIAAGLASAEEALTRPAPSALASVDRWDPGREVPAITSPLMSSPRVLERPVYGARRPEWAALEDKIAIGPVLEAAGLAGAGSEVVDATDAERLLAAHRRLASADGTVWAADNRLGTHGGGERTYWVADEAAAAARMADLVGHDRVRVMPFVEGLPCSVHGLATATGDVAVFRPCEQMILRDRSTHRFVYARAATYWDPDPEDRAAMVDGARAVGRELVRRVGYRGFFTLDGILGVDGFVATEVNTRLGAALPNRPLTSSGEPLDLLLLGLAVVAGELDDLDAGAFERWLVPLLDRDREASAIMLVDRSVEQPRRLRLVGGQDGEPVAVEDGTEPGQAVGGGQSPTLAVVEWGPGPGGSMLRFDEVGGLEVGRPVAPELVEWLRVIDRHWALDLGPLEPARPVR